MENLSVASFKGILKTCMAVMTSYGIKLFIHNGDSLAPLQN